MTTSAAGFILPQMLRRKNAERELIVDHRRGGSLRGLECYRDSSTTVGLRGRVVVQRRCLALISFLPFVKNGALTLGGPPARRPIEDSVDSADTYTRDADSHPNIPASYFPHDGAKEAKSDWNPEEQC